jgi:hypothetical protein
MSAASWADWSLNARADVTGPLCALLLLPPPSRQSVYTKVCAKNEQKSRGKINAFDRRKKQLFRLYDDAKKHYEEMRRNYDDMKKPNPHLALATFQSNLADLSQELARWMQRDPDLLNANGGIIVAGSGTGIFPLWPKTKAEMMGTVKDMRYRPPPAPAAGSETPRGAAAHASGKAHVLDTGDTRDIRGELEYFGLTGAGGGAGAGAGAAGAAGASAAPGTAGSVRSPPSTSGRADEKHTAVSGGIGFPPSTPGTGGPPGSAPGIGYGAGASTPAPPLMGSGGVAGGSGVPAVSAGVNPNLPPHKQLLETLKRELYELSDQMMDHEALLVRRYISHGHRCAALLGSTEEARGLCADRWMPLTWPNVYVVCVYVCVQTEQLNGVIDNFEAAYKLMKDDNLSKIGAVCAQLQEQVTQHFEALAELHRTKLDKLLKDELVPRPSDAIVSLISDKDAVNHSLEASKNVHSGLVGEWEEKLTRREDEAYSKLIKDIHRSNIQRYVCDAQHMGHGMVTRARTHTIGLTVPPSRSWPVHCTGIVSV